MDATAALDAQIEHGAVKQGHQTARLRIYRISAAALPQSQASEARAGLAQCRNH
jgi:hypothetical protein